MENKGSINAYKMRLFNDINRVSEGFKRMSMYIETPISESASKDELLMIVNDLNIHYDKLIGDILSLRRESQGIYMYEINKK